MKRDFDIRSVGTAARFLSRQLCIMCLWFPYRIGLVGVAFEKRISLLVPARNLPCSQLRVVGGGGVGGGGVVEGSGGLCECVSG